MNVHPIEVESYRRLNDVVDLGHLGPAARAVVERVIHASADPEYAATMVLAEHDAQRGIEALRAGAPVVADVQMVRHAITGVRARCYLPTVAAGASPPGGATRSQLGMRVAAGRHPQGAVVVVGCAPTALAEVLRLHRHEGFEPALVIGLPVGFVGAAAAKEELRTSGLAAISNVGMKGGSAVAAAAVNALVRMAGDA